MKTTIESITGGSFKANEALGIMGGSRTKEQWNENKKRIIKRCGGTLPASWYGTIEDLVEEKALEFRCEPGDLL